MLHSGVTIMLLIVVFGLSCVSGLLNIFIISFSFMSFGATSRNLGPAGAVAEEAINLG